LPFNHGGDLWAWICARGANCSDPRYPSEYLPETITHWMPLPDSPPAAGTTDPMVGKESPAQESDAASVRNPLPPLPEGGEKA
jgi:hypothetical protein